MSRVNEVAELEIIDGVAVVTIDSPPVNALSLNVRAGLVAALQQAQSDPSVAAILILCGGRTFFAGADITEFGKPFTSPNLIDVEQEIDACIHPVIAAMHGTALGGGLETALACDYRIAVPSAKLGLPEVSLGLLPGAGGTQRLPRLIGAAEALDMIAFGRPVTAQCALELGLIDAILPGASLRDEAIAYARELLETGKPRRRIREMEAKLAPARAEPGMFASFTEKHARAFRGFRAPGNIIKAVEAAVTLPFEAGMKREAELFEELMQSRESAAQRHLFFAERLVAKIPDIPAGTPARPTGKVGIIGAGTMGGGIAMNFLNIGTPVTLVETSQEALDRGVATIRRNYEATIAKGRLSQTEYEKRIALLNPTLAFESLGDRDLVIEAVYENLPLKQDIFARLGNLVRPDAILASNTSFLDLDAIASATAHPERVIGLHFFSPANVMRLLEVVRGARTAPDVVVTGMSLGRKIGKLAVLAGVCDGFIANRAMMPRTALARDLSLEGPSPADIDRVMTDFGFPMGPFAMLDLVGLDVIGWDANTSSGSTVLEVLCEAGRWGQKKGAGYYDYDDKRRAQPSPEVANIIADFAARGKIAQRSFQDAEIVERLLYPIVNEGTKILEEGVALRAADIDVALVTGYGWPVYTGGPMFWADGIGLDKIVSRLDALAAAHGDAYRPSALLRRIAAEGGVLHELGKDVLF
jgi:3-hydroxyacyl-CoA dehydrogenase